MTRPTPPFVDREAWLEMVLAVRSRLGMYTPRGTYNEPCALLVGFNVARGASELALFTQWLLVTRPARLNLAFPAIVLYDALGSDEPRDTRFMSEAENAVCVQHLSTLLEQFLADEDFLEDWEHAGQTLRALKLTCILPGDTSETLDVTSIAARRYRRLGALKRSSQEPEKPLNRTSSSEPRLRTSDATERA